jgi:hypothetical protein
MRNLNKNIEALVKAYGLSFEHHHCIDLNDRCLLSLILTHSHTDTREDGSCYVSRDPVNTILSVAFFVREENSKEYDFLFPVKEFMEEKDFYNFMIEAKKIAKQYINQEKITLALEEFSLSTPEMQDRYVISRLS